MNHPKISIVVAIAEENRAIGRDNKLPWEISSDLKRFKQITSGHPIIMGRKTFESIGRPLPNRTNIIITRDPLYAAEGCIVVNNLESALQKAKEKDSEEIFIIGGGEIFRLALPYVDRLYLTIVHQNVEGDVFFPDYTEFSRVIHKSEHLENGYSFTFLDLER
jgi:dihydrofolate reductase